MTKIICIVGPSGAGKTELAKHIEKTMDIKSIVSYTTRPIRDGETNGVEHYFVKESDMPGKRHILAYTKFGGYYYWTTFEQLPKDDVITYTIDERGLLELIDNCNDNFEILSVFIDVDKNVLKNRIDSTRSVRDKNRVHISKDSYDAVITNNCDLDTFLLEASKIISDMLL